MQKFENMDVIAALEAIMHQNTAYYQSDFAFDIKMLREVARSDQPEDKLLLWLSRPSGTFCFRERDVLLKDTQAYNTWKFCGEQTHDRILAYAVELTGAANGTVQGNLYELDYQQHFRHIRDAALPVGANRLIYESGMREIGPKEHFDSRSDKYFGEFVRYEMRSQHIRIFALQDFICKLSANLVGLLRRGFARRKRLYQVVGQIVAFLHGL